MSRIPTTFSITKEDSDNIDELAFLVKKLDKKINSRSRAVCYAVEKLLKELKENK